MRKETKSWGGRVLALAQGRGAAAERGSSEELISLLLTLAEVVADVAGTADLESVAEIVTGRAAATLGADLASLCVREGADALRIVGHKGDLGIPDTDRRIRFPVSDPNPISEAVRLRQIVVASSDADMRRKYPGLADLGEGDRSLVVLPLLTRGRCVGAASFSFPVVQELDDFDRKYLGALADSCAQAVDRITATDAAAVFARKLAFLADASTALAESLDYESTLRTVADLAVPDLADWCTIDLLENGALRRVAISHIDPAKIDLAAKLRELYPPDMGAATGAPEVARTGRAEIFESIDDELLNELHIYDERRRIVTELQLSSAITVALKARGKTLGVLTLVYAESERHYTADDIPFAEDLARRAALAIDNAQLHSETLEVALRLQSALLPESFGDIGPWQVAVHYRPAGRTEVGGDFYDAITLPDQRLVAVVGDVMGRGITAAATMAQTRSAIRAYLAIDPDPVAVLQRLDAMFVAFDLSQLVTVLYVLADPVAGEAQIMSAGHLPPLVVRDGDHASMVPLSVSPPLGLARGSREVARIPVGPDELLLLFTDGLVERRGEDIDEGIQRLADHAPHLNRNMSDAAVALLADSLCQAGHDDDLTVLAVRRRSGGQS